MRVPWPAFGWGLSLVLVCCAVSEGRVERGLGLGNDLMALDVPVFVEDSRSPECRFSICSGNESAFFDDSGVTVILRDRNGDQSCAYRMSFVRCLGETQVEAVGDVAGTVSYFRGPKSEWRVALRRTNEVRYCSVWPGVDVVFRAESRRVKFDIEVAPGARVDDVAFRFSGLEDCRVDEDGAVVLATACGDHQLPAAETFQIVGGVRRCVPTQYGVARTGSDAILRLSLGTYDISRDLVIDPVLFEYSGYIGGSDGFATVQAVTFDKDGYAYVVGRTNSTEAAFPVRVGPDLTYNDTPSGSDAFVAKVDRDGSSLIYCGYIGGAKDEFAYGIAVDDSGCAYVCGFTESNEASFPVAGGPALIFGGVVDGFVAKVSADGSSLDYCGYVGGAGIDHTTGIGVDRDGLVSICGTTFSDESTFPVVGGPDVTYNGFGDAYVARLAADGTHFLFCGYIGGQFDDIGLDMALDRAGSIYCVGYTGSREDSFPVKVGPSLVHSGGFDAFVVKVAPTGDSLEFAGFIGGSADDRAEGVAVDSSGVAYIGGATWSDESSFPIAIGPDTSYNSTDPMVPDGFVCSVTPTGNALRFCGYVGGADLDWVRNVRVDEDGNVYACGFTDSGEDSFPVVGGPDVTYGGGRDGFVAMIDRTATRLDYCGYIGGGAFDDAVDLAVTKVGRVYVGGNTRSDETTFPVSVGPDLTFNGVNDAFVSRLSPFVDTTLRRCRAGAVGAGSAGEPEDVLFVNGSSGDFERVVAVCAGCPIEVRLDAPSVGPSPALFALYGWKGSPSGGTVSPLPFGLGSMCFPSYLTGGSPLPFVVWNNAGHHPLLGVPTMEASPAPTTVTSNAGGVGRAVEVTFQGLIMDSGSAASVPASVTNAVVLRVQ